MMQFLKSASFKKNVAYLEHSLCQRGMSISAARKLAKETVAEAESKVRNRKTDTIDRPLTGTILLSIDWGRRHFDSISLEGVSKSDFLAWWDLDPLTRECILFLDTSDRYSAFSEARKAGKTDEDATKEVQLSFPIFGTIKDTHSNWRPQDLPLPVELKFRVGKFMARMNFEQLHEEVKDAGSFNAYLRRKIQEKSL